MINYNDLLGILKMMKSNNKDYRCYNEKEGVSIRPFFDPLRITPNCGIFLLPM